MNRSALEHVLRAAAAITGESMFYVVGTAAIVASLRSEAALPGAILRSREADLVPACGSARSIDHRRCVGTGFHFRWHTRLLCRCLEFSTVSYAPDGWRDRTIRFATAGTKGATGLCMEPHDLAISKLCAGREKDLTFVRGVIEAGLVEIDLLFDRLGRVSAPPEVLTLARQRLQAFRSA